MNWSAFAAILEDGPVVTWGHPGNGGDSGHVRVQLVRVQQIQAANCAFAALLTDGSVVTWGDPRTGGDSSQVQEQLVRVHEIQTAYVGFAAILQEGFVVTWGDLERSANSKPWLVVRLFWLIFASAACVLCSALPSRHVFP